jgi:ribonuclease Z
MPTLLWSLAKAGRRDPVEVWGPAGEHERFGTLAYARHLELAHAWDMESLCGHPGQSGARAVTVEVPYDRPEVVYERNGVTITSFPVIHIHNGAVGYRLDYAGCSVVFSGDTRPCRYLVEACGGADLLIHETFPTAEVLSAKAGMPLPVAEMIVNGAHTSPAAAGMVFKQADARMSAMRHLVVDHETVGPVFEQVRSRYDGPVVISQDLTVFNVTKQSVVARQRTIDPFRWPVVGESRESGPPMSPPLEPPAWWADALITD